MIIVFKAKEQRCTSVWWWWQKHKLHWQNVGTNIEGDKLTENVYTNVDHSAITIRQERFIWKRWKADIEISFHFQNPVTLWRMLTQHFRDMSLKYTSRCMKVQSQNQNAFAHDQSKTEQANSILANMSQSIRVQSAKIFSPKYAIT